MRSVVRLFWLLLVVLAVTGRKQCFNSTVNLNYTNTQAVYDAKLTVFFGAWDTQAALAMILYILLQEKIGFTVEMWPQDEWDVPLYSEIYTAYAQVPQGEPYYNAWIRGWMDHDVDIMGEFYKTMYDDPDAHPWLHDGMLKGPITGSMVGIGFFVPYYMVEKDSGDFFTPSYMLPLENTNSLCPYYLQLFDADVQKMLSRQNYTNYFNFTSDRIPIWGAVDYWAMTQRAIKLLEHYGLNETYELLIVGTEPLLTEVAMQMYNDEVPFIMIAYTPSFDSAQMELRPVHLPYNPSGLLTDPCFHDATCEWVDEAVEYERSKVMHEDWPEVSQTLSNLEISRTDIIWLIADFLKTRNLWETTCTWARNNEEKLNSAISAPLRYEWITYHYGSSMKITFTVIPLFLSCGVFGLLAWYYVNWNSEAILTTSPAVTRFWFLGHILLYVCIIITVWGTESNLECTSFNATLNMGLAFLLIPPSLRSYRIASIFDDAMALTDITSAYLIKILGLCVCWEMVLFVLYAWAFITGTPDPVRDSDMASADDYNQYFWCGNDNWWAYAFFIAQMVSKSVYLITMLYYANESKKAWEQYRETKFLIFHAYLCLLIAGVMFMIIFSSIPAYEKKTIFMLVMSIMTVTLNVAYVLPLLEQHFKIIQEDVEYAVHQKQRYDTEFHKIVGRMSIPDLEHASKVIDHIRSLKSRSRSNLFGQKEHVRQSRFFSREEIQEAKTLWDICKEVDSIKDSMRRGNSLQVEAAGLATPTMHGERTSFTAEGDRRNSQSVIAMVRKSLFAVQGDGSGPQGLNLVVDEEGRDGEPSPRVTGKLSPAWTPRRSSSTNEEQRMVEVELPEKFKQIQKKQGPGLDLALGEISESEGSLDELDNSSAVMPNTPFARRGSNSPSNPLAESEAKAMFKCVAE